MMTLKKFKVTNFRSIMDSGWIECDNITSLVGINEAGKSNIILALWKLRPARNGEIEPLHDMPTKEYTSWRDIPENITFITAEFELDDELVNKINQICNCDKSNVSLVNISRRYDKEYIVSFPNYVNITDIKANGVIDIINNSLINIKSLEEKTKTEAGIKDKSIESLNKISEYLSNKASLSQIDYENIRNLYPKGITHSASSLIFPAIEKFKEDISNLFNLLKPNSPSENEDVKKLIIAEMPSFVYYSNYGNLDAQIYLPHAVKWLKGEEVEGIKNDAKVRTLRVLFDFVKLNPTEILELGKDPVRIVLDSYGRETTKKPSDEEIAKATQQKTERSILLNSASADLTRKFKDWWKQGDYTFRFQADGEFFKIWVSDDKRQEPIELERRSTGLQWFLSFFLVFLVESNEAHKGSILLLDEAGLSLHPLAQKDLIAFFENLSKSNQIIHTTHSPFLVDTTNIDHVKVVYTDNNGNTVVSSDLRASDDKLNERSIYAVHAALGLSVSDILLQGCQPIIVEGPSDQHYFNAIKLFLLKNQKYAPNMELVFMPSGGIRGIPGVVSIVSGKNGDLPLIILDSDKSGQDAKKKLLSGLYQNNESSIIEIGEFLNFINGEVEDLIPHELMLKQINRIFRDVEDENIESILDINYPIVPQIEKFALKHGIVLDKGWKVELSKSVKQQLQKAEANSIQSEYIDKWSNIFAKF
ncbi:MAG: AAA family ATPase [Eubacteriaceae bacterium]